LDVNKLNHGARVVYHNSCCATQSGIFVCPAWQEAKSGLDAHPPACAKQLVFYLWNIFVLALPSMEYNNTILGFICGVVGTDWHQNARLFVCHATKRRGVCVCVRPTRATPPLTRSPAIFSHQHH
jgi:hypothetical protein